MTAKKLAFLVVFAFVGVLGSRTASAECAYYSYLDYTTYTYVYITYDSVTGQYGCVVPPPNPHPNATKHILYLHGRGSTEMRADATVPTTRLPADWSTVTLNYDGDDFLYGNANTVIKNGLKQYCRNGHSCAVIAYSAANNRLLYAINQLNAEGTPPTGMLWTSAIASAAGGTGIAHYTTKKFWRLIAKLTGFFANIDSDLSETQWSQGGQYSNLQNLMPVATYHFGGGGKDMCIKLHFLIVKIKLCGNGYLPGSSGDGVVPMYSSCGYADTAYHGSCCEGGYKYANRFFDSYGSCNYPSLNHLETIATGLKTMATTRIPSSIALTFTDTTNQVQTGGPETNCNPAFWDCDHAESDGNPYFYVYEGFQNSVETNLRPFTCGDCNVFGLGNATSLGMQAYYPACVPGGDPWACYYSSPYYVYSWSVATTWGQVMTCTSASSAGTSPSCY